MFFRKQSIPLQDQKDLIERVVREKSFDSPFDDLFRLDCYEQFRLSPRRTYRVLSKLASDLESTRPNRIERLRQELAEGEQALASLHEEDPGLLLFEWRSRSCAVSIPLWALNPLLELEDLPPEESRWNDQWYQEQVSLPENRLLIERAMLENVHLSRGEDIPSTFESDLKDRVVIVSTSLFSDDSPEQLFRVAPGSPFYRLPRTMSLKGPFAPAEVIELDQATQSELETASVFFLDGGFTIQEALDAAKAIES